MRKVLFLLGLIVSLCAFAQTTATGSLQGTVADSSGAMIPAAKVKVLNADTGQSFETTTNEHGLWTIASLPSATYVVSVVQTGFKTFELTNVKVDAGVPATANIVLQVGAVTETVEVQAQGEQVQSTSAERSGLLDSKQMMDLQARGSFPI